MTYYCPVNIWGGSIENIFKYIEMENVFTEMERNENKNVIIYQWLLKKLTVSSEI